MTFLRLYCVTILLLLLYAVIIIYQSSNKLDYNTHINFII